MNFGDTNIQSLPPTQYVIGAEKLSGNEKSKVLALMESMSLLEVLLNKQPDIWILIGSGREIIHHTLFIQSSADGHSGRFQLLAAVKRTAANTHAHALVRVPVSLCTGLDVGLLPLVLWCFIVLSLWNLVYQLFPVLLQSFHHYCLLLPSVQAHWLNLQYTFK